MPSLATEQPRAWHSGSPQWRVMLEASPTAMSTASVAPPPPLATPPKDADIRDQALGLSAAKSEKALRLAQLDTFIMHAQQPRWQWLQRMHRNDGKKQSSRVLKAFFDVERSLEANEKGRRRHLVAQSAKGMVSGTSSDLLDPASMSPTGHHSFPSGSTDAPSAKLVVRRPKSAHGSSKQPPKWDHSTSTRPTRAAARMVRERGLGLSSAYRRQPPGQSKLIGTLRARLSQLEQLNALASTPVELHTNVLALKGRSSRATSKARGHQTEIEQLRRRLTWVNVWCQPRNGRSGVPLHFHSTQRHDTTPARTLTSAGRLQEVRKT